MKLPRAMSVKRLVASLRGYSTYPLYWFTDDGGTLSRAGVLEQLGRYARAARACARGYDRADRDPARFYTEYEHGWAIIGCDVNWEDQEMTCAETGEPIQPAYGEAG